MNNYHNNQNDTNNILSENFSSNEQKSTNKSKNRNVFKVISLALCFSILGGIIGAGGVILGSDNFNIKSEKANNIQNTSTILEGQRKNTVLNISNINTDEKMTAAEIYTVNVNSTVGITTSITTNYFGYQTTSAASGSGFILTDDGYIVTNFHVIDNANAIKVTTFNGKSYDAILIGYDESNDIAVLKVEANDLIPVILGDSDNTNVGDDVIAIGNPLGELTFSLTAGAISALEREVTFSNNLTMDLIQTDCAINSGNSGGALFNMYGEVIGITNAKYSSSSYNEASIDNIGFAIPINSVKNIIEELIEKGYVTKPYIGITIDNSSSEIQNFGLPAGAVVMSVTQGSPAEEAGLSTNDIITAVNNKSISTSSELKNIVSESKAGDMLVLTVYRRGQTIEINVTVGEEQTSAPSANESIRSQNENYGSNTFPWGNVFDR